MNNSRQKIRMTKKGKWLKLRRPAASKARPEIYDLIGDRLRVYFDEVARQPVPERFVDLLSKMETVKPVKKPD